MKFFLKKKLVIAALVPVIGMPLAVSSFAQTTGTQGATTGQPQQQSQGQKATEIRDMRASEIIGAKLQSPTGQDLGDVQDLIVNADQGQVDYAIVAFGGTLGFGEKLFAYPMDRFQAGSSGDELVLNATKEEMDNAPGFDRSTWPTWGTGGYRGEVEKHFGQTAQAGGNLVRMSELLKSDVQDQAGNEVGKVEDLVVSVTDGKVRYVALEPDSDLDMGNRLVMLPMNAIRATGEQQAEQQTQTERQPGQPEQQAGTERQPGQPEQQATVVGQPGQAPSQQQQARQQQDQDLQLVLNIQPNELKNARTLEKGQWPDLNDQAFQKEMDSYVASFPAGGQAGTSAGATGTKGETGTSSGATGTAGQTETSPSQPSQMERDKPAGSTPSQEGMPERQPGTTGQSR